MNKEKLMDPVVGFLVLLHHVQETMSVQDRLGSVGRYLSASQNLCSRPTSGRRLANPGHPHNPRVWTDHFQCQVLPPKNTSPNSPQTPHLQSKSSGHAPVLLELLGEKFAFLSRRVACAPGHRLSLKRQEGRTERNLEDHASTPGRWDHRGSQSSKDYVRSPG